MNYHKKTFLLMCLISLMMLGGCVVEPLPAPGYYEPGYPPVAYEAYPYYHYYYGYEGPYWGGGHHHHHHR